MNIFFSIILLIVIAVIWLGYLLRRANRANVDLQHKLDVVESLANNLRDRLLSVERQQQESLSQDQLDYRDKVNAQYATLFKKLEEDFKLEVKGVRAEAVGTIQKARKDFEGLLQAEFDKACEKIAFDEIEYKKTITKKRRQFNRKNSHRAKPAKVWRSISED